MSIYKSADIGKRFLAYLVDYFVIGFLCNLVYYLFIDKQVNFLTEQFISEYPNVEISGLSDFFSKVQQLPAYSYVLNLLLIYFLITIIITLVYFIVLPLVWEKQTIGRALSSTKLVNKDDKEVTLLKLLRRQVLGRFVFIVLASFLVGIVIEVVLALRDKSMTIEDYLGGTKLVESHIRIK